MKVLFLAGVLAVAACRSAGAGSPVRTPIGDLTEGNYLEASGVFSSLTHAGYAPIVIRVKNDLKRDLTFAIKATANADAGRSGSHRYSSDWSFTAKAGGTSTHKFVIPLCTDFRGSGGGYSFGRSSLTVLISGDASASFSLQDELASDLASTALSTGLTANNLSAINAAGTKSSPYGRTNFACEFAPDDLPEDWRGYTGLDFLALRSDEWMKLAPGIRTAILQWVQLGGNLDVYTSSSETAAALNLPDADPQSNRVGFGTVKVLELTARNLSAGRSPPALAYQKSRSLRSDNNISALTANGSTAWNSLQTIFGRRAFNAWQVGIVLLIFGVLVGPVNLFHFAKSGRRHRLFFTTPIISLAASVILLLVIFFQDGTGGHGVRSAVVYLNPTDSSAFIRQNCLARTGVLFGSSFNVADPSFISPVLLPNSQWTRLKEEHVEGSSQSYSMPQDKTYAGDWFQSRSEQALAIQTVHSTRGRIELASAAGDPPKLRSSLAYSLESIWYIDDNGDYWTTPGSLAMGQGVVMQKSNTGEFESWRRSQLAYDDDATFRLSRASAPPRGHFFAATSAATPDLINTLPSITWQQNRTFIWGPVPHAAP